MTGFGAARSDDDHFVVGVEIRAVNNRYLKVTLRAGEPMTVRILSPITLTLEK